MPVAKMQQFIAHYKSQIARFKSSGSHNNE